MSNIFKGILRTGLNVIPDKKLLVFLLIHEMILNLEIDYLLNIFLGLIIKLKIYMKENRNKKGILSLLKQLKINLNKIKIL